MEFAISDTRYAIRDFIQAERKQNGDGGDGGKHQTSLRRVGEQRPTNQRDENDDNL